MTRGPLSGVRVFEFAGVGALPFAGMLLADLGCEIVQIRSPRGPALPRLAGDGSDPLQRGKASLIVDLSEAHARDRLLDSLTHADVLIEAMRPGKMEALGLGPAECFSRAPHLVYGRSTGWGQSGPMSSRAGHDPNYLGYTGALCWPAMEGRPALPAFGLVGDVAGGSLYLVIGVLAALHHARETGQGQVVDASILDGTLSIMTTIYSMIGAGLPKSAWWSSFLEGSCPFASIYATSDGGYMSVCALEPPFFAELLDRLEMAPADLPAQTDVEAWPALRAAFADRFCQKTRAEWEQMFADSDACVTPVLSPLEARSHPVNAGRGAFVNGLPAAAPRFASTPTRHASAPHESAEAILERWRETPKSPSAP